MNFSACAGQLLSTSLVSQPDPLASVFSCLPDSTSLTYVSFEHGGNNCMRRVRTFALELSNTILSTRSWPLQIYIYTYIFLASCSNQSTHPEHLAYPGMLCLLHSVGPLPPEPFEQMVLLGKEHGGQPIWICQTID